MEVHKCRITKWYLEILTWLTLKWTLTSPPWTPWTFTSTLFEHGSPCYWPWPRFLTRAYSRLWIFLVWLTLLTLYSFLETIFRFDLRLTVGKAPINFFSSSKYIFFRFKTFSIFLFSKKHKTYYGCGLTPPSRLRSGFLRLPLDYLEFFSHDLDLYLIFFALALDL